MLNINDITHTIYVCMEFNCNNIADLRLVTLKIAGVVLQHRRTHITYPSSARHEMMFKIPSIYDRREYRCANMYITYVYIYLLNGKRNSVS